MAGIATLLHISDLHFDGELTQKGRRHWKQGVNSHGFGKVDALSATLFSLKSIGREADILLATGDISTDGMRDSLKIALEFLEGDNIYRGNPRRLITKGLGVKPTQRLILPGNHDRYMDSLLPYQGPSAQLEKVFGTPDQYPYTVGYRRPANAADVKEPAVIFFVFDSTAPETLTKSNAPWVRVARGRVEDAECRWLAEQPNKIKADGEILGLNGSPLPVDYENAVRIAVLHHHPVDKKEKGLFDSWKIMENNTAFIDACCEARVDVVLFGHQHEDYRDSQRRILGSGNTRFVHEINFICCPSTTEFSEKNNGFYFLDFDADKFTVNPFVWNGKSFVAGSSKEYRFERKITISPLSGAARLP